MDNVPKMNFHTHTTYCDGTASPEAMIQAALKKGFTRLGFSGHCFNTFHPEDAWCMSREATEQYRKELQKLAEQYEGQIEILCGVEQDAFSEASTEGYAYVIGSAHYVEKEGIYYCIDESAETLETAIREGFGGDAYALAEAFFAQAAEVVAKTNATVIGHFDLVTKFNEGNRFFDPREPRFHTAALTAIEALLETGRPFEINTGAMYRGLRTEPYPSVLLLREIQKRKGTILFASDSHDGASLGFAFPEMVRLAKEIGFSTTKILTKYGLTEQKL